MKLLINEREIEIEVADTFYKRLIGLMFKTDYKGAMLFKNTRFIHTFGMKFKLNVIYLNKDYKILNIKKDVKPKRILLPVKGSKHIIELKQRITNVNVLSIKKTS